MPAANLVDSSPNTTKLCAVKNMNRKPSLLVIFLTVFIDLVGFGIVVPLVPIFTRHYGASGWVIGAIIASFSAMQFVFSPIWGRLSDRHGRRPILLISTAGAALSYVLFAVGSGFENHTVALWTLLVSRVFAGICGGNITVAQAPRSAASRCISSAAPGRAGRPRLFARRIFSSRFASSPKA